MTRRAGVLVAALAALAAPAPDAAGQDVRLQPDGPGRLRVIMQSDGHVSTYGSLVPAAEKLARVPIDPVVMRHVRQLESTDYAEREAALEWLERKVPDNLQLYAILETAPLSPEQRHRLLGLAQRRLRDAPRGAMGVQMQWAPPDGERPGGVRIENLIAGLPAERVLELRDVITHIDGDPLESQAELVNTIQAKAPGDVVRLTVQRVRRNDRGERLRDADGQFLHRTVEVDLALTSVERLLQRSPRGNVSESAIERQRKHESMEVMRRFSPGSRQIVAPVLEGATEDERDEPVAMGDVDQHEAIQQLLWQKRLVDELEGEGPPPELEESWRRHLEFLRRTARAPNLPEEHRAYLERVCERYADIIEE